MDAHTERMLEYAKYGDVDAILAYGPLELGLPLARVVSIAAQHGHIQVLKQCVSHHIWTSNPDLCRLAFLSALKWRKCEVLEFIHGEYRECVIDMTLLVRCYAVTCSDDQIDVVEWWMTTGWVDDNEEERERFRKHIFHTAVSYGKHNIVRWLLERGVKYDVPFELPFELISDEKRLHTLRVLHEFKVNIASCKTGTCVVCKEEEMWNVWIMETHEFTNMGQWLPREMMEDVNVLLSCKA